MFTTRFFRPLLRFRDTVEPNVGGEEQDKKPKTDEGDLGFPANTPVLEMTIEQQAAYWKHQSRKHEKRARPKDFDQLEADAQKWREHQDKNATPDEKAINAAKAAGRTEGVNSLLHDAVRAELKAARPHMTTEELDEFLEDVALDRFLGTDGRLDTERVSRLADKLAAPAQQEDGTSEEPPNGGMALGLVLGRTNPPPKGNELSVEQIRQQEAARYSQQTNQ